MTFASAYLIRQVADYSGGSSAEEISRSLGEARKAPIPSPLSYTHTRFVMIGNTDTEFGAYTGGDVGIGNDYPDGTIIDGCEVNGIAKFDNGEEGLAFCMCKTTGYDSPAGQASFWIVPCGGELRINWVQFVNGTGQLWTQDKEASTGYVNKIYFMWNIPLFETYAECMDYRDLVLGYWTSGLDDDLDNIQRYLETHMTGNA